MNKIEKRQKEQKAQFLKLFESNAGNIGATCKSLGIERKTYYNWCDKDPEFEQAVKDQKEMIIDFVESALMRQVKEGNMTAIIFFLKCQAKKRGYVERQEHVVETPQLPQSFVFRVIPDRKEEDIIDVTAQEETS